MPYCGYSNSGITVQLEILLLDILSVKCTLVLPTNIGPPKLYYIRCFTATLLYMYTLVMFPTMDSFMLHVAITISAIESYRYHIALQSGVVGVKCSDCDVGFFALSSDGCLPCNCSGRTSECRLKPGSTVSEPQELCQCQFPYTGDSCEMCVDGHYLSSQTGNCEPCQCNGRADTCEDGTGICIVSLL